MGRAIGPSITGLTFSWGVKRGYVIPPWWLLAFMAVLQAIPVWMIVEGEGLKVASDTDDEDDLVFESDDEPEYAIIAGDAPDMAGVREDAIPEPEDGLAPLTKVTSGRGSPYGTANRPPSRGHKLRRMSATGKDLEHAPSDARWRLKQRDDEVEA